MANVEYINPFIEAAQNVLRDFCRIDAKIGKPYLTNASYEGDTLMVIVGITGDLRGQVIINMNYTVACGIASHMMMGMPVPELNDMAKSAVSELANMILGNSATLFSKKGIALDITPPSICSGNNLEISVSDSKTICIPLLFDGDKTLEINVAIKER
ncbi:MAG: chemotaxis protein CheX [Vallitaleaceae bacterium]|nr:chemotaxis protein CheX [Vallitaleaceae bacterium]